MALTSPSFPVGTYLLPVPARSRLPWSNFDERRVLLPAFVGGVRAPRVELAAGGEVYQVRRGPWDRAQLLLFPCEGGHRVQEADRIGMARVVEDLLDVPELHDASCVGRGHSVCQFRGQG